MKNCCSSRNTQSKFLDYSKHQRENVSQLRIFARIKRPYDLHPMYTIAELHRRTPDTKIKISVLKQMARERYAMGFSKMPVCDSRIMQLQIDLLQINASLDCPVIVWSI